jgi:regulator of sigma E protease
MVVKSLGMMFTGQVGLNDLAGPVGTVSVMSSVVEQSKTDGSFYVMLNLFNLTVMISANLGVMNLLPLPALDGGRLVFLLIEAVRGKPVKREREGMVHFVGMVLLMLLMVYVMFKDIKGLF